MAAVNSNFNVFKHIFSYSCDLYCVEFKYNEVGGHKKSPQDGSS